MINNLTGKVSTNVGTLVIQEKITLVNFSIHIIIYVNKLLLMKKPLYLISIMMIGLLNNSITINPVVNLKPINSNKVKDTMKKNPLMKNVSLKELNTVSMLTKLSINQLFLMKFLSLLWFVNYYVNLIILKFNLDYLTLNTNVYQIQIKIQNTLLPKILKTKKKMTEKMIKMMMTVMEKDLLSVNLEN